MNNMVKNILAAEKIHKSFNGQTILDGVSFALPEGKSLGIAGGNGSGKTTLLNILSGLTGFDGGRIFIDGVSYSGRNTSAIARSGIGRSFQYARNFGSLTTADNLLVTGGKEWREGLFNGLFSKNKTRRADREVLEEAVKIADGWGVDIGKLLQTERESLGQLSLGQQRLVELLRLFLYDPRVFLLDEPTVHLSGDICLRLAKLVRNYVARGRSFIIISHDPIFLSACTDEVLFLEKGRPGSREDSGAPARRAGVTGESAKKKLLVLSGLSAGYNGKMICEDVDLAIAAGEIVTITGENGCGKSTLLRAILGLCRLSGGEIGFNDQVVHNLLPEERVKKGISYVFQDKRIFSRMTVEENLKVAYSGPKGSRTLRLNRVHDIFPVLKKKARLPAGLLSGGEQQMLAVGRVLMQDPRLILLDEPFSGLAENFVEVLLDQIRRLADSGIAILIIEHRIDKAAGITDRLFVFKNGKLE